MTGAFAGDDLTMFNAEDDWLGEVVEVYEGGDHLGTIGYHFDHTSPAYYFHDRTRGSLKYLCWQDDVEFAINRFKRRYYAARRRSGL